jgi:hypothetical protein
LGHLEAVGHDGVIGILDVRQVTFTHIAVAAARLLA